LKSVKVTSIQDAKIAENETSEKELNKKIKIKFSDPDKLSQQHYIKLKSIIEEVRHSLNLESN
jgi:hypothetical protein